MPKQAPGSPFALRLGRPAMLLVMVACAVLSWTLFTAWGVMAAYVGSHEGAMASRSELDPARAKATSIFFSMIALQLIMVISGGFFVRTLTTSDRSVFWPKLKNWIVGFLVSLVIDGLVFAVMIYGQMRG